MLVSNLDRIIWISLVKSCFTIRRIRDCQSVDTELLVGFFVDLTSFVWTFITVNKYEQKKPRSVRNLCKFYCEKKTHTKLFWSRFILFVFWKNKFKILSMLLLIVRNRVPLKWDKLQNKFHMLRRHINIRIFLELKESSDEQFSSLNKSKESIWFSNL